MISLTGHADVYILNNPFNVVDAQTGLFLLGTVLAKWYRTSNLSDKK
jgi:hypothetical protein